MDFNTATIKTKWLEYQRNRKSLPVFVGTDKYPRYRVAAVEQRFFYFRKNENRKNKSQTTENQQLRLTAVVLSCF